MSKVYTLWFDSLRAKNKAEKQIIDFCKKIESSYLKNQEELDSFIRYLEKMVQCINSRNRSKIYMVTYKSNKTCIKFSEGTCLTIKEHEPLETIALPEHPELF
jgi:hypothetical protein